MNINKPFKSFESGQLSGLVGMPKNHQWSHEFERSLDDTDLVYVWLAVQHNKVVFRNKQGPFIIGAIRDPNFKLPEAITEEPDTVTPATEPDTQPSEPNGNKQCMTSITELPVGDNKHCKGDLLFEDNFDNFNNRRWTNEVRLPVDSTDFEFVLYNGTAYAENGVLKIPATLYPGNITTGTIALGNRYVCITSTYIAKNCAQI